MVGIDEQFPVKLRKGNGKGIGIIHIYFAEQVNAGKTDIRDINRFKRNLWFPNHAFQGLASGQGETRGQCRRHKNASKNH
jgi:hypothetical protein